MVVELGASTQQGYGSLGSARLFGIEDVNACQALTESATRDTEGKTGRGCKDPEDLKYNQRSRITRIQGGGDVAG